MLRRRRPAQPAGHSFTDAEVVSALYGGLLDRAPDPLGLAHNLGLLEAGTDLTSLVRGMRRSPEVSAAFLRSADLAEVGPNLWRGRVRRTSEPLVYFCHIMKTGGTALVEAMAAVAGDRFCLTQIFLDHLVLIPSVVLRQASLVSGHLGMEALELLPADTVTVTVLRDPLERTLSHYAHVLADPALSGEAAGLSLEEFCTDRRWKPLSSNFQARSLVQRIALAGAWTDYSPEERLAALEHAPVHANLPLQSLFDLGPLPVGAGELGPAARAALDGIEHVGVSERLDDLWASVARVWDISEPVPPPQSNVSAERLRAERLAPSLRRQILENNAVDLELYEQARRRAGSAQRSMWRSEPLTAPSPGPATPVAAPPPPSRPAPRSRVPLDATARLGLLLCLVTAGVDAIDGHLILIAALVAGPCAVLGAGRWRLTGMVGSLAVTLALLLGAPDGIWLTATHLALVTVVAVISLAAVLASRSLERRRAARPPSLVLR
ncbi:MAG TPA: DUF4214 domain-containing protein [Acidimicrobiales bacterium]|nr:DUF4214 domain-containing protein [Acidimicrobiales bacterium]